MDWLTHSLDEFKSGANAEFELWVGSYSSHWNNSLVSHHQPSLLEPTFSSERGEAGVKMWRVKHLKQTIRPGARSHYAETRGLAAVRVSDTREQ